MKKSLLLLLCVLLSIDFWGQHANSIADSINASANINKDTLQISLNTSNPKVQMSFLMQGLRIEMLNSCSEVTATLIVPNASDVRNKILHHPNEVKAMHKGGKDEVRPDLLPLVSALNTELADIYIGDTIKERCKHHIKIDKEHGNLSFSIIVSALHLQLPKDSLRLCIISRPNGPNQRPEFSGNRLSKENRLPPGGLGNAPTIANMREREIRVYKSIPIKQLGSGARGT